MSRIGYAYIDCDNNDTQLSQLAKAGCAEIYADIDESNNELVRALAATSTGDGLVVQKLARLGKSPREVAAVLERLERVGAHLIALDEDIDTAQGGGRQVVSAIFALGDLQRQAHGERVRRAMKAVSDSGLPVGRPEVIAKETVDAACRMIDEENLSYVEAAKRLSKPVSTLWKAVNRARKKKAAFDN